VQVDSRGLAARHCWPLRHVVGQGRRRARANRGRYCGNPRR